MSDDACVDAGQVPYQCIQVWRKKVTIHLIWEALLPLTISISSLRKMLPATLRATLQAVPWTLACLQPQLQIVTILQAQLHRHQQMNVRALYQLCCWCLCHVPRLVIMRVTACV